MFDQSSRAGYYEELLRRFASGVRAAQLCADHPLLGRNVDGLLATLKVLQQQMPSMPSASSATSWSSPTRRCRRRAAA